MYKEKGHFTMTKTKSGIWYYYAYDGSGNRIRRSTGEKNKRVAREVILRRIAEGRLVEKTQVEKMITFEEFSEPFWIWESCPIIRDRLARKGHYSVELCLSNRKSMEKHILPAFRKKRLCDITRNDVNKWLLSLPDSAGISTATANKMLVILRQMLDVAVYDGLIDKSPAADVKPFVERDNARDSFTRKEVCRLISASWDSPVAYAAAYTAALTGMRLGEIRGLFRKNVHPDHIVIETSWSDVEGFKSTKNGKTRVISIPGRISDILMNLPDNGENSLLFSPDGKKPYSDTVITTPLRRMMRKLGIDAGGKRLSFHSFRHFFNTQMVASGVKGEIIRSAIGHSSAEMPDHYLHIGSDELSPVLNVPNGLMRDIEVTRRNRERRITV